MTGYDGADSFCCCGVYGRLCPDQKGYTTKTLVQLRQDVGRLIGEETRSRQDLDQAEILRESAEALNNQAEYEVGNFDEEISDLLKQLESVQADLGRSEKEAEEGVRWIFC